MSCITAVRRMVNTTDIVELELKSKRFSLAMRKKEAIAVPEPPQVRRLLTEVCLHCHMQYGALSASGLLNASNRPCERVPCMSSSLCSCDIARTLCLRPGAPAEQTVRCKGCFPSDFVHCRSQIQYMQAPAPAQQTALPQAAQPPLMSGPPMASSPPPMAAPAPALEAAIDGVEVRRVIVTLNYSR